MIESTLKLYAAAFEACQDLKAEDLVSLDLSEAESYTDVVLVASANSERQLQSIADQIQHKVFQKCHKHPLGTEGYQGTSWILIDFGDVICHVFLNTVRGLYHLEDMWPKVKPMDEKATEKFLNQSQKVSVKKIKRKK
jgi:ribosome-associated protein